jgi:hypothetical protein
VALFASSQFSIFEIIRMAHWHITSAVLWEFANEPLESTFQEEKMGKCQARISLAVDFSIIIAPRPHESRSSIV